MNKSEQKKEEIRHLTLKRASIAEPDEATKKAAEEVFKSIHEGTAAEIREHLDAIGKALEEAETLTGATFDALQAADLLNRYPDRIEVKYRTDPYRQIRKALNEMEKATAE